MIRIVAEHQFVAGLEVSAQGRITRAAPIIKYMLGWTTAQVLRYCNKRGWKMEFINE